MHSESGAENEIREVDPTERTKKRRTTTKKKETDSEFSHYSSLDSSKPSLVSFLRINGDWEGEGGTGQRVRDVSEHGR